jgi:hypothetical protein
MTIKKRNSDRSLSPIERYYNGELTVEQYLELVLKSSTADHVRKSSERRVRRILNRVTQIFEENRIFRQHNLHHNPLKRAYQTGRHLFQWPKPRH